MDPTKKAILRQPPGAKKQFPIGNRSIVTDSSGTKQSTIRTALAGLIGNVLEWFDFAVYGYFAGQIGHQFFPSGDPAAEQFRAFATSRWDFLRDQSAVWCRQTDLVVRRQDPG